MNTLKTIALLILILGFTSCAAKKESSEDKMDQTEMTSENVEYTCSMHPEVSSDKPGKCPKCGMELVKRESSASDSTSEEKHTH
jgi:hypothetical protein